jgi:secondary thiamine-phosphate synthase enzyme
LPIVDGRSSISVQKMLITESIQTRSRCEMIDITHRVQQLVTQHDLREGIVVVAVPHTTAGVTINENADPDVRHDMLHKLATLIPHREPYYRHSEGNSDSHVKTTLTGNSSTIIVDKGQLVLGRWQGLYFCEYDGPRSRQYHVTFLR